MRHSFTRFCQNIKCAEVGVADATNAIDMLVNFPFAHFTLVDSYDVLNPTFQSGTIPRTREAREDFIANVIKTLEPYKERVQLIVEDSAVAAMRFPDNYFDYIYIDAEHDALSVVRDLTFWMPKLKDGGTIGGHDAGAPGVKASLIKFFGSRYITEGEDWYLVKR